MNERDFYDRRLIYTNPDEENLTVYGNDVYSTNSYGVVIIRELTRTKVAKHLIPWQWVIELRWFGTDPIGNM